LFPDYVAKVIEELPNIKQCVIVCIDDPDYKSIPIAFAVMKDYGNREIVKAAIVAHVSEVLPVYCVPKRIIVLDEIPMTPIGKIDYRVLEEAARK
jgi:long-chain acyl-CoA synthetase